ncbi:MAG: hypothetical protein FWJ62_09255 [Thermaerobacter sp.]|nr:hypothetical protein [Bacillota bacterium]
MASLLIPDFYPLRADAGSTEPVILGQTDLSIPYPWIRWLELLYRFRGYIDVTSFLLRRPEVMVLLFEVYARAGRYFGFPPQMVLEVYRDPEVPKPDEQLCVLIQTALPVPEAFARLNALDREWWLDVPWDLRRHVILDVEFLETPR